MAFDAFLKIATIPGESTDDTHQNWIEILSYSHGLTQAGSGSVSSGGSRTAERCDHQNFTITKTLDKASPLLALACCNGEHIAEIILEICRAGGDKNKYMEYTLNDVIVASVQPHGSTKWEETLPIEQISFNYGKIKWSYIETDHRTGKPGGTIMKYWDLTTNSGG